MVAPIDDSDRTYVLLSSLDETIVQHEQSFNLALHRYRGVYEPRGHKYITDFRYTPTPTIVYRVGGVVLQKELLWIHKRTQLMIRYTLLDAHSETTLRLRPLLAFRDKHLCREPTWRPTDARRPCRAVSSAASTRDSRGSICRPTAPMPSSSPHPTGITDSNIREELKLRLRGSRRSDDHRLLRVEDQEGRERDILSLDRHDGLGADDRRRVRSLAGTPNPQDRLSELPATLGTSVRHTSSGRAHGGHSRLPVVRPHRTRHVHVAARHNADAGLQGGLHGCTRYDDSRHARRRLRRLGLGDSLGRRTAVVLLDVAESRKTYRPEGAVVALRRGHEVRLGGLSPRHGRRRGGHARQRPDMGCGRQPTPDVDGDYGRRTSRHAARRIRRRDRGVVVQRRHVHLGACTQA